VEKLSTIRVACLLSIGSVLALIGMSAQATQDSRFWDSKIGEPGVNGPVTAVAVKGSELYIGGYFSQAGGLPATNIAKWDGTNWSGVGGGVGYYAGGSRYSGVNSIVSDGFDIFVAGVFTNAGALFVQNIAKWDGTNWTGLCTGLDNVVFDLAIGSGAIYAGGQFGSAGGMPASRIAKWNGTDWSPLGTGLDNIGASAFVHGIAVRGNELYVGGRFALAGGHPARNIARWDGTNWTGLGTGLGNDPVYAVASSGERLYAGGGFRNAGLTEVRNIAVWDGTNWAPLGGGVTGASGSFPFISAIALNGTEIFVAGADFNQLGGVNANNIGKWDGYSWAPLSSGLLPGSAVYALAASGAELFVGGYFPIAGNTASTDIALWHIPHSLNIQRLANEIVLSWPATGTNFVLEATADLGEANWQGVSGTPNIANDECVVTLAPGPGNQFFRLRRK